MKRILALLAAAALAGCASFSQAIGGYQQAAVTGLQAANDNIIAAWSATACGTPLSAVLRHPEVIPALKALCMPAGAAGNPSTLLDTISTVKGVAPDGTVK